MEKINLTDMTFNIPVRFDTIHRVENITLIVDYIQKYFNTNIIVMEESKDPRFFFLQNRVKYIHVKTDDPHLHRTRCLNLMAKESNTPFISNYDTDVLFKVHQYIDGITLLRNNQAQMVFPYAGKFMEVDRNRFFQRIKTELSVDFINESDLHCNHPQSLGGAIFWNKSKFMEIGMENETFKSWGWEDNERVTRAVKLGTSVARTSGLLYHMMHDRLSDSNQHNPYYNNNMFEYFKVNGLNPQQLKDYINTWTWRTR